MALILTRPLLDKSFASSWHALMGRVALWPGRSLESIADGQVLAELLALELEDASVSVPERSGDRRTCSMSSRIDQ